MRLQKFRNADGVVEWNGFLIPHIKQDTALEYHIECIRDLLRLSIDPEQIQNVDLLAASIILRTDEEMDDPGHEGKPDKDVFLRVTGAFMDAQTPSTAAIPQSSPQLYNSGVLMDFGRVAADWSPAADGRSQFGAMHYECSTGNQSATSNILSSQNSGAEGLRQACLWIALRQELHASFMNQRAFTFPLSKFDTFHNFCP